MLSRHSAKQISLLFLFFVILGGCGQKGELYLPEQTRLGHDAPARPS